MAVSTADDGQREPAAFRHQLLAQRRDIRFPVEWPVAGDRACTAGSYELEQVVANGQVMRPALRAGQPVSQGP